MTKEELEREVRAMMTYTLGPTLQSFYEEGGLGAELSGRAAAEDIAISGRAVLDRLKELGVMKDI